MNKQLICTRWIPASWKSTWADSVQWAIILNKDNIREELHNWIFSKENERIVIDTERERTEYLLKKGYKCVIVDNTHLWIVNPHITYYKRLAGKYWYEFEVKDFYISREEAIKRDKDRDRTVGIDVIDKMIKMQWNWWYPQNPIFVKSNPDINKECIIVDIDWTLAFMDWKRSPYDYSKVGWDRANEKLKAFINTLFTSTNIILLSWREESCRDLTEKWLAKNSIRFDKLLMRETWDNRKDSVIKKEIYKKEIEPNYNTTAVFDDRQQVVDMWRLELNLPCYQAWYWNF